MKRHIWYHTNWSTYGRNFQVSDIPDCVSDIAYAFFDVTEAGNVVSRDTWSDFEKPFGSDLGNLGALSSLKKKRALTIQLSLFGWTYSKTASLAARTEQTRNTLVKDLVDINNRFPGLFDGFSIDWEYPSNDGVNYGNGGNVVDPSDADNFIKLLEKLRQTFPTKILSICTSADPDKIKFDIKKASDIVDELHVMTYDFHCSAWGETITAHHTNPRKSSYSKLSCEEIASHLVSMGIKSTKIFIGGALYSRGFAGSEGMGKPCLGVAVSDKTWEDGVVDYKLLPLPGAIEYNDPESLGAYSYDPVKKIVNSYDNPVSIKEKCKIIQEYDLGGIILWESSGDYPVSDTRSIAACLRDNINKGTSVPVGPSKPIEPIKPVPEVTNPLPEGIIYQGPVTLGNDEKNIKLYRKGSSVLLEISGSPDVPVVPVSPVPVVPIVPNVPIETAVAEWKSGVAYKINDVVSYNGLKYSCRIAHNSLGNWTPSAVPALWLLK
jgi:chitinase